MPHASIQPAMANNNQSISEVLREKDAVWAGGVKTSKPPFKIWPLSSKLPPCPTSTSQLLQHAR